tara:strand:+ start:744 stop:992 length:249 start_codon:yes stop_codon:yes gene_type:complete
MGEQEWSFPTSEFDDSFRRAFEEDPSTHIQIDGRSNRFLKEGIDYGIEGGILKYEGEGGDFQWTSMKYSLTSEGREYLGLSN